jgi:hypothetical protein
MLFIKLVHPSKIPGKSLLNTEGILRIKRNKLSKSCKDQNNLIILLELIIFNSFKIAQFKILSNGKLIYKIILDVYT